MYRDELNGVHVLEIYYVGHAVRTTRLAVIHQVLIKLIILILKFDKFGIATELVPSGFL